MPKHIHRDTGKCFPLYKFLLPPRTFQIQQRHPRVSEDGDLPGKAVVSRGGTSLLLLENSHQLLHAEQNFREERKTAQGQRKGKEGV